MSEQPRPRITDAEVAALPIAAGRAELLEQIMADTTTSTRPTSTSPTARTTGSARRWLVPATVAAAVGVVATLPLWVGGDGAGADRGAVATTPPSPTAPAVAGTLPALVAPGWTLHDIEARPGDGEIDYRDARDREVLLQWDPIAAGDPAYDQYYDGDGLGKGRPVEFAGGEARLWGTDGDVRIVREAVGGHLIVFRAELPEQQALDVAAQVRLVDLDGLAALMPDDVVTPDTAAQAIADAAADVPLPPGLDVEDIELPGVNDRYELGVAVTGTAVCGWSEAYFAARDAGDDAGVQAAVTALSGSQQWAILQEMAATGDWGSVVAEVGDAMAAGTLRRDDVDTSLGCAELRAG
ncbi:hypothetical protein [Nocardioides sp.]|uniref:hypothetical protein n=1 Tax=Nocardioides sp. TaxID=35761 RepID=UPI0035186B9D